MCKTKNTTKDPVKFSKLTKKEIENLQNQVRFLSKKGHAKSLLVTYTNFVVRSKQLFRSSMYSMRSESQRIMTMKEQNAWIKNNKAPRHQICGHNFSFMEQTVNLTKTVEGTLAFRGLAQCLLVWRCPICSFKILAKRREELQEFYAKHQAKNLKIGFITLTIRHTKYDTLQETLSRLKDNYRRFQNTRWFKKQREFILGQVKSLEITYSKHNGWHPHFHILFFYKKQPKKVFTRFHKEIQLKWASFRDNNGLPHLNHAKLATNKDIAEYTLKWDLSKELTDSTIKKSKHGFTPFQILKSITFDTYKQLPKRVRLINLWREYLEATVGVSRCRIGKKLREAYPEIEEKTDEQLVKDVEDDELILQIQWQIWLQIAKKNLQAHVINFYLKDGLNGIYNLLNKAKIEFDVDQSNETITLI